MLKTTLDSDKIKESPTYKSRALLCVKHFIYPVQFHAILFSVQMEYDFKKINTFAV